MKRKKRSVRRRHGRSWTRFGRGWKRPLRLVHDKRTADESPSVCDKPEGVSGNLSDTLKGAKASAVIYTLVESAKANGLDIYEYLKYLLAEMPNNGHLEHPEVIDRYLPWSSELPEECRLNHRHKKCLINRYRHKECLKS